jgi:glycosyltransferase involved in cell wall biosynthesis
MIKPTLAVLFGQPDFLSTSYQTSRLVGALERWFEPRLFPVTSGRGKWSTAALRVWSNYLRPFVSRHRTDFVLYANDGVVDLSRWEGKKILYWYDAARDWSREPPPRRDFVNWLRYQNIIRADYVFAVSQIQVEVARRLRPGREDTISYLPVGVDCGVFDPTAADATLVRRKYGLPAKLVIGYLGYLGIRDGRFAGELLVEIAPQLTKQANVHFLIVGFGPALEQFKQRVAQLGLTDNFTFTGFVPDELLPSCLAAMDICVDTLEVGFHSEARSETKLKQYMAMGRCCVATAIGENCVDLDGGECGVLVAPGSENLLPGLLTVFHDDALRERLGSLARQRAVQSYDWSVLAKRMAVTLGVHD